MLMTYISGRIICYIIYFFFQTTVTRPDIIGDGLFLDFVRYAYKSDMPFNCFPSLHVQEAFIVTLFIFNCNKNIFIRLWSIISCVSITLSTLFIKQHYLPDIISAMLVGTIVYTIFTDEMVIYKIFVNRVTNYFALAKLKRK
jgi:membrane-associated phospholipid phosphatase